MIYDHSAAWRDYGGPSGMLVGGRSERIVTAGPGNASSSWKP